MALIILLILIGAYFMLKLLIDLIREKIKNQNHLKKVQIVIYREQKYPDAYKEWFGPPYYINSLNDKELDKRLSRSEREWAEKQREIEESRAREKALNIEKEERLSKARSLSYRYPKAVKEIIDASTITTESQVEKVLSYSISELKRIESEIIEEEKRIKAEKEQKYTQIISNYPNGYALVSKLREECIDIEDLYLPDEYNRFKRGLKVATNKQKLTELSIEVFDKYEDISIRYSQFVNWHKKHTEFSDKVRQLRNTTCLSDWGAYSYNIERYGITQTGDSLIYNFNPFPNLSYI